MKIKYDEIYEGIDIYRRVNKDVESHIEFFKDQMTGDNMWRSVQIYEMLDVLEKKLKLKLED